MFRTWLFANLGMVYFVCLLIIIGVVSMITSPIKPSGEVNDLWTFSMIVTGVISFVVLFACEPNIGPAFTLFLLIGGYLLIILIRFEDGSRLLDLPKDMIQKMNKLIITLSAVSLVPAFFIARYCYLNFDDVVSRRWLYRNSGKDVFESTWKYTINRFLTSFVVIAALILDIVGVVAVQHLK